MTIQINWTEDAEKALEICEDLENPDWEKIHGSDYGPLPAKAIFARRDKKRRNLSDFRGSIREHTELLLHEHADSIESVKSKDREKQFTQDDLYAIDTALEYARAGYFVEEEHANRLKEELESMTRLDHLIKAIFG